MASPLAPEEGAPAYAAVSKNVDAGQGSTVRRPGRLRVMHPDVAEFLLGTRHRRTKKPAPATPPPAAEAEEEGGERARYDCAFEDEGAEGKRRFAPPRLVWSKVNNHPWWPGQVFDPADASELAQQHYRRRGTTLVAYFWDKTFAWADAAALRPFRSGFPRLAGQSTMSTFASAVDAALGEVARRVDVGLLCSCAGSNAVDKKQVIDNAGVREGAYGALVDAAFTSDAFRGEAFVEYISALAMAPLAGADRLDLTIATAQLKAFTRWRGPRGLPEYTASYGIEDVAIAAMEGAPSSRAKRRRSRGGDDGDASAAKWRMSRCSRARENAASENVDDTLELEDFEPSPQPPSHQISTKIGKLMSRAAQQMSQSPVIPRANGNAPQAISRMMGRCTRVSDESPSVKNGDLKDDPLLLGLVLNFSGPSALPSTSDLVKIFSQFGPIKEARAENSVALVIFKRPADAERAFSGTTKINALSASLISFRLTYSLSAALIDPPRSALNAEKKDHLPAEAVQ